MVRVLVFDESPLVGKLVEHYLKKHGWTVESHVYAGGLADRLEAFRPDVLLVDPDTPGLASNGITRLLKDTGAGEKYKIVCMSYEGVCPESELAREGLLDGQFAKCYTLDGLQEVIAGVLGR